MLLIKLKLILKIKELKIILGDQLNPQHSWFKKIDQKVIYVMMETKQETGYVVHHIQKIIAIFAAMRNFAQFLKKKGHNVKYFKINDKYNLHSFENNLDYILKKYDIKKIFCQYPDEYRVDLLMRNYFNKIKIKHAFVESEHFFSSREEIKSFFKDKKRYTMEHFYRYMRVKHKILLQKNGNPEGNKWNFDNQNRMKWKGKPKIPNDKRKIHDHSLIWKEIKLSGIKYFGEALNGKLYWPVNRKESLKNLNFFVKNKLIYFGFFQDTMNTISLYMFHSSLSFAINTKMLSPKEIIYKVEKQYRRNKVSINSAEGFIRQILGWREYIRGVYWRYMPNYLNNNYLNHVRELPNYFWNAKTKMNCMHYALKQSLKYSYAHHNQRLMIIGNFSLLIGLSPHKLHLWYLGIYIDAYEWVEAPNTLGLSQYADNGLISTKPYISSANYINKISNYCNNCFYQYKKKYGARSCPYNSLYWDFLYRNKPIFINNYRLKFNYTYLNKISILELKKIIKYAKYLKKNFTKI